MVNVILTRWSEAVLTHSVLSGIISSLSAFAVGPRGCFQQTAVWCLVVIGACRITVGNVGYIILSVLKILSGYREN